MECGQRFPSQPFALLSVDQFVEHGGGGLLNGMEFLTLDGTEEEYNK